MNEIHLSGKWNFSSIQEEVAGELYIDPSKGIINLIVYSEKSLGIYNEFDTITGQTIHGYDITLYKCYVAKQNIYFGSQKKYQSTITAEFVFEGIAFKSKDEILFHEINFRFSNLDEWAYLKGFELYTVEDCDFSLVYKTPEELEYIVDDETSIIIKCSLSSPLALTVEKEVTVKQRVYVTVKHKNPQEFETSLNVIRTLMNFVSLSIGRPVNITEISGFSPNLFQIINDKKDKIYHKIPTYSVRFDGDNYKPIDPRDVLLNLQDVKSNFQMHMNNWFEKSIILRPVVDLYLNTLNYQQMSLERHFLNLVQALESYHRRTKNNYVTDPKEHKLKIQTILDSIPEEYKKWLGEKLNFSHEPSLQDRLLDLLPYDEDVSIFKGYMDVETLIKKIKHTRNYHTHYDLKLEKKALKGEELELACSFLRLMLEYLLLQEIGLPKEIIREKLMEKSRRIRTFQMIREHHRKDKE